jgi:hypothetical protein
MSFITTFKKQFIQFIAIVILLNFASCSSFQYAGTYEDSIYSESNLEEQEDETTNPSNASEYYKNYFKEKSLNFEGDSSTYTDSESYEGYYSEDTESEDTDSDDYAGWGQNNSSDITINIYDTTPFYGNWWGSPFYNNWNRNMGWNMGWSNYGYIMDPFGNNYGYQQIPWGYNYWNYGFPNYGYYGFPNNGYNNYYGYGSFSNNRGSSVSYVNGPRGSRYANNVSSRSASNSSTLKKLTNRSNTSSRNIDRSRNSRSIASVNKNRKQGNGSSLEKDITSKFGVGSIEHVEYLIEKRKESSARQDNRSSKKGSPSPKAEKRQDKKRKESLAKQNNRYSKKESPFPKAVKRPSTNSSYSRPSTTRSSGASSRVSGGTSSRRKR